MKWIVVAGLLLASGWTVGCASPCDTLATAICERSGATSTACQEATLAAERARIEEQRACERVSAMTQTLSKNR
jgi:hypothetical protein